MGKAELLVSFLLCISTVHAVDHLVGGSLGWTETLVDYIKWAVGETFIVGDKLIFNYDSIEDVIEVDKYGYDNCVDSGSNSPYTGGETTIALTSPGPKYFICSTSDHCWGGGMKLAVMVEARSPGGMNLTIAEEARRAAVTMPPSPSPPITPPSVVPPALGPPSTPPLNTPPAFSPSSTHPLNAPPTPSRADIPPTPRPSDIPPSGGGVAGSFCNQNPLLIVFSLISPTLLAVIV